VALAACAGFQLHAGQAQPAAAKQAGKTVQTQSQSTFNLSTDADGSQTVVIHNVSYEYTGSGIPGRPQNERLLLRKTIDSKAGVDDVGVDGTVMLEAWPLGADVRQKPLYTIKETGAGAHTVYPDLWVVDRGLEEVEWWSVHKLGSGQRLFDTYVPLVSFSISWEYEIMRYVGLEVPPDDAKDARLRETHVVAVLTYASPDRVIREALLTCDNTEQAALLRSYADSTRALADIEAPRASSQGKKAERRHSLKLAISQDFPSPPETVEVIVPIAGDDLDIAHAQLPRGLHLAAWKR
jgi:hypothetical protein